VDSLDGMYDLFVVGLSQNGRRVFGEVGGVIAR
jgi:hypothetical protein